MNFHPQAAVPPTRFLNQHAKDAAKLRILLWRAIIFLVYSSIHCLGMFVLAVFGFRAFSDLSKFNELNQKHKWNISLVLIFGSYKSRASPTQWQLHNSHPTATLPKPLGCSSAPLQTSSENSFGVCYFSGASSHFTCKRASPPLPHNPTAAWNHHNSKASCSYDTSAHKNKAPEEPQVRPDSSSICLPLIWLFTSFFMERQRVPLCPQRRQGPNFGHTLGRQ